MVAKLWLVKDLLPEEPNMHMLGSEISQIFWGSTPRPPLPHLQTGIYDFIGQVYTDASAYRPRRYHLLQIILTTLKTYPHFYEKQRYNLEWPNYVC